MSDFTLEQLSDRGMPVLMQMLVGAAHDGKKITYKDVAQQFRKVLGKPFLRVLKWTPEIGPNVKV